MSDWIFAFFHLFLILAIIAYAIVSFLKGNVLRFALIIASLIGYYFLVLHKAVKKEIKRKRENKLQSRR